MFPNDRTLAHLADGSPQRLTTTLSGKAWGNEWEEYECPTWMIACLDYLGNEMEICHWNKHQSKWSFPGCNAGTEFKNDVFEMRAYCWNEDSEEAKLPNFKCGDIEIRWYKYLGRGTTINREVSPEEFIAVFEKCRASLDWALDE